MRIAAVALVLVFAVAATARAGGGAVALDVAVGQTVEQNVGFMHGWFCDDPSLLTADMVTRDDHNVWIVTGVKAGTTLCRVGTDLGRHILFELRVTAAH